MRVAVVGGGISGLAAALCLVTARNAGQPVEEHLFEGGRRLGGVLFTDRVDGCVVEAGPDSFLTEKPQAAQLAAELGIGGEIVGSNDRQRRTYIVHQGKLAALPDGLMFLVPTRLLPMATTPLIPLADKVKMLGELFYEPRPVEEESVASFVERHFGRAMVENIADPLLAGVYGGDAEHLSIQATLPRFAEMEEKRGSLIRAVLEARKNMRQLLPSNRPLFSTLKNGLSKMVTAIEERLAGDRIHCGSRIDAITVSARPGNGRHAYGLAAKGGVPGEFDALILALPAYESACLLEALDPQLAALLSEFPYSSSMTVVLGYPARVRDRLPPGFGFLVPRKEGHRLLACTFVHAKFPSRVPPERALLRCFLGGSRDPEVLKLSDDQVEKLVREELKTILWLKEEPLFVRVYRWHRAMAQYSLGHRARVAAVHEKLAGHPGLFLAGNWDSGIGISDCIRSGQTAAINCLRYLGLSSP